MVDAGSLRPEPAARAPDATRIQLVLHGGRRINRRFCKSDTVADVHAFAAFEMQRLGFVPPAAPTAASGNASSGAPPPQPSFVLVSALPTRRELSSGDASSLADAQLLNASLTVEWNT